MLAEGKTCRVIGMKGDEYVNYDIKEALKMEKGLDPQTYPVMKALTGID